MLANDYTQVNDLGYGLFRNNAALSNKLHIYILQPTAFLSNNGPEIRAQTVPTQTVTLVWLAAGFDPNETLDAVTTLRECRCPERIQ